MIVTLPRIGHGRKWEYTLAAAEREGAYFEEMEEYIWIKQNTVAQFIATQSILYLCEETDRTPGPQMGMQWQEKAGIDLTGTRERAAAAEADKDRGEQ